jgi:hypothetical protein
MTRFSLFILLFPFVGWSQSSTNDEMRGPINNIPGGVIDGVVLKEDLPLRSKIEYEHVREADFVWSKRVFSRIDAREKINHPLFFPSDFINQSEYSFPSKPEEISSNKNWLRHQERLSLWTIIEKHLLLGDLTLYMVRSEDTPFNEDGYQFKYPLVKNSRNDFFDNSKYRDELSKLLTFGKPGVFWTIDDPNNPGSRIPLKKGTNPSFKDWLDSLTVVSPNSTVEVQNNNPNITVFDQLSIWAQDDKQRAKLENAWNNAKNLAPLKMPAEMRYITSESITAYNIKEDWFFDKERSMLDRRIIAIAPVAKYRYAAPDPGEEGDPLDRYDAFLFLDTDGDLKILDTDPDDNTRVVLQPFKGGKEKIIEREMFWLYFPELRDVMINYYVYNEQNDAQWMSFDDLFWKRKFNSTIYRVSDKFDREIEDYKHGVDALYEAERIKDDIRKWEIDVWNY